VYNLTNENGTKRAILDAFKTVQRSAKSTDTVLIYISGYAVEVSGRPYFIPVDGNVADPRSYVDLFEVQRAVLGTFGRRILLIDSCGVELTKSLKTVLLDDYKDDQVTVLAAALPGQAAFYSDDLRHGFFTYALLEGISGRALPPGGSELTINDLGRYVTTRVEQVAAEKRVRQVPYTKTDDGNFVLIRKQ
jgi:uncharacterized caspase-like protein